jgi:threonine dehydratase
VRSKKMAAVISGGNVDPARLISCLEMTVKVVE